MARFIKRYAPMIGVNIAGGVTRSVGEGIAKNSHTKTGKAIGKSIALAGQAVDTGATVHGLGYAFGSKTLIKATTPVFKAVVRRLPVVGGLIALGSLAAVGLEAGHRNDAARKSALATKTAKNGPAIEGGPPDHDSAHGTGRVRAHPRINENGTVSIVEEHPAHK